MIRAGDGVATSSALGRCRLLRQLAGVKQRGYPTGNGQRTRHSSQVGKALSPPPTWVVIKLKSDKKS